MRKRLQNGRPVLFRLLQLIARCEGVLLNKRIILVRLNKVIILAPREYLWKSTNRGSPGHPGNRHVEAIRPWGQWKYKTLGCYFKLFHSKSFDHSILFCRKVSGCQGVYFNKNQFKNFNKEWKRELELKVRNLFNM